VCDRAVCDARETEGQRRMLGPLTVLHAYMREAKEVPEVDSPVAEFE